MKYISFPSIHIIRIFFKEKRMDKQMFLIIIIIMGALCQKQEAAITAKPRKCSNCSMHNPNLALVTFETCPHFICQTCLAAVGDSQPTCPMKHKKQKNLTIDVGKQIYDSVMRSGQDQLCSQKHKMVWKDKLQQCSICKTQMHGFKCRTCSDFICTQCATAFDPKKNQCPNKHSMVWQSAGMPCLICGTKRHGWSCRQCRWYSCSECCGTRFNSNGCPNLHSLVWSNLKQDCLICKSKDRCFQCKICNATYCSKCTNYYYDRKECPNRHLTKLTQKHSCTKCELDMPGMRCEQCNYHFCTRCDLQKYSTTRRPQQEAYQSIRVVVQNPLLQLQQFQKKSSGMKDAASRLINSNKQNQLQHSQLKQTAATKPNSNDSELLRQQIQENPGEVQLYLKLAESYKSKQNYTNQIRMYQEAWDIEEEKQNKDPIVLFRLGEKALQRALAVRFRKCALIFLNKLIGLAQKQSNEGIRSKKGGWQLSKVQQLLLSKEVKLAKEQFQKLRPSGEQYNRIRSLLQQASV